MLTKFIVVYTQNYHSYQLFKIYFRESLYARPSFSNEEYYTVRLSESPSFLLPQTLRNVEEGGKQTQRGGYDKVRDKFDRTRVMRAVDGNLEVETNQEKIILLFRTSSMLSAFYFQEFRSINRKACGRALVRVERWLVTHARTIRSG